MDSREAFEVHIRSQALGVDELEMSLGGGYYLSPTTEHAWAAWQAAERAAAEKIAHADLCLQAVSEARAAIKANMGDNCAFLDDDLVRWVTTAREHERRATAARCRELCEEPADERVCCGQPVIEHGEAACCGCPNPAPKDAYQCADAIAREFELDKE